MNLIEEHNKKYAFFKEITGVAMQIHREYHPGLFSEWYELDTETNKIEKITLM